MTSDARLFLSLQPALIESLYKTAEEQDEKIGAYINKLLKHELPKYQDISVTYQTNKRFSGRQNPKRMEIRVRREYKDRLKGITDREIKENDPQTNMSEIFTIIATNFL